MGELYEKEEGNGGINWTASRRHFSLGCVLTPTPRCLSQERERADMDMMLSRNNGVQATAKLAEAGAKGEQSAKL